MSISTPDWVKSAVFYQIFPDRFRKGSVDHFPHGISLKPWGTPAAEQGFQGGDLYGVIEKLDYLLDLGITALYLNPIFSSASNHRYHTYDYFNVDPLLGGNLAFRELVDQAHLRGMKIIIDGVFNHASRGFWPFHHILENGEKSPYLDWFHVKGWPLNPYPLNENEDPNYKSWWSLPGLPKFNTDNPGVREYLFRVASYWIGFGIDGWRLDAPAEIDDDSFWREFRLHVKRANPDAYITGEIWTNAERWLQGDQFDGVLNYPFGEAALRYFGARSMRNEFKHHELNLNPFDCDGFIQRINEVFDWYDWQINQVQLNLIDSHDMPRAKWLMNEDSDALKLTLAFILSMPGAPCIYYGTEVGMSGGHDPHSREAFPWHDVDSWDVSIGDVIRQFAFARRQYKVLSQGAYELISLTNDVLLIKRFIDTQQAYVFINRSVTETTLTLGVSVEGFCQLNDRAELTTVALARELRLAPNEATIFINECDCN